MVKRFLIITLLISISKFGISQDIPNFIPPSPESVSLAKFIETPVSHYTGLPHISVPIYTINEKGISIPVSVDYHARGIKVEEIASRVGIGWALNYGGLITRQIRGSADESPYGYLHLNIYKNNYNNFFTNVDTRASAWMDYCSYQNDYDFVPDQFYLNANNISGKFIFDQTDGKPVLQKFDNVTITPTFESSEIASFVVKDSEGNTYYFGKSKDGFREARDFETTKLITKLLTSDPVLSNPYERQQFNTWHLMEIETPDNGRIEFIYGLPEEPRFYRRLYDKVSSDNIPQSFFSYVEGHQFQLREIRFSTGKLVFTPETYENGDRIEREDIDNAYALNQITLSDLNNNIKKKFKFSYEYTTATNNENQLDYLEIIEPKAAKRLFLKSIQEVDNQNAVLPPYTFDYSTTILPNRFSNSQDVWGYYNGANNGQFLTFFNYSTFNVDRSVDTAYSEAGLLKRITYPTGGSTEFTYEQNIAIPNHELAELVFQSINPAEEKENGLGFLDISCYNGTEYTKTISIGNIVGNVDVINFWVQDVSIMDFTFSIEPISGEKVYALPLGSTIITVLDPGDYYLKVTPKKSGFNPLNPDHAFNINLSWKEQPVNESDSVYAGGKRILKLENKLADNSSASIREFKYENPYGVSSGKIFGVPNCYSINKKLSTGAFKVFQPYGAVPGSPLSMGTDNTIGYSSVVEYLGSISNNTGKTEYEFTDIENTGDYYVFPYHIPTDNEWLRGKPLRISNYMRNANGTFELVRKIDNEYLYGDEYGYLLPSVFTPLLNRESPIYYETSLSLSLDPLYLKNKRLFRFPLAIFASILDDDGIIIKDSLFYKVYYLTGGTLDLKKAITTEYTSGVPTVVTTNEYFYDYDHHYQLSRTETTNSNGNVIKKNFWYPSDYNLGVENFDTLTTNNIVGKPIDVRTYNGSNLTSGSQTRYNDYGQPIKVYRFESTATDIAFSANNPYTFSHKQQIEYNSSSRIKRATPDNDISTYYVWAYNNQYPVVKIESANASLAIDQIQSSVDGIRLSISQNKTLVDLSISSLQTAVGAYVSGSDMVTYYTYTPLTGMTSQTDPNGITTYYEYDDFSRLTNVRNDDWNVVGRNYYHYYSDTSSDGPSLSLSTYSMNLACTSSSVSVTITSNCSWSITSSATWLTLGAVSGSGNRVITLNASANTGSTRNATVTVMYPGGSTKTIAVSQIPSLSLSVSALNLDCTSSSSSFTISSNCTWTIASSATWLSVSPSSGNSNSTITVTTTANTGSARSAIITVTYGGTLTKTVMVSQAAYTSTLSVDQTDLQWLNIGDDQEVNITSNTSWTVTESASWIIISPASGTGNGLLTIGVKRLTSGSRSGTVTVKTADNTKTVIINIYQSLFVE